MLSRRLLTQQSEPHLQPIVRSSISGLTPVASFKSSQQQTIINLLFISFSTGSANSNAESQVDFRQLGWTHITYNQHIISAYHPNQMSRKSQQIEMEISMPPDSDRALVRNLVSPRQVRQQIPSLSSRSIFGADFAVEEMNNPEKYLQKYNQNNLDQDNCMTCLQSCCGEICLALGSIFPLCCTKCCVYELQTSSAGLVQVFGKFTRLLKPGFNRINPCSQQVRQVDMRIKVMGTGTNVAITKDNVKINIETSVAFRVTNPIIVYYQIGSELNKAVIQLVISSFRKVIGLHVLQDVLTDRQLIVTDVIQEVTTNMLPGILIENVFIDDLRLPHDIERDLSSVARQKRISQATIINSQADVETASLMQQSAQLLDTKAAMQIRYLEMVQEIGRRGVTLLMDIGVDKKGASGYGKQENQQKQQKNLLQINDS